MCHDVSVFFILSSVALPVICTHSAPYLLERSYSSSLLLVLLMALCPLHTMACDESIIHVLLQELHLNAPEVSFFSLLLVMFLVFCPVSSSGSTVRNIWSPEPHIHPREGGVPDTEQK